MLYIIHIEKDHHYYFKFYYSVISNYSKPYKGKSLYFIIIERDFRPALNAMFYYFLNFESIIPFIFKTLAKGGTAPGSN